MITRKDGTTQEVKVLLRIDTPIEVDYYNHGGILPFVLRELVAAGRVTRSSASSARAGRRLRGDAGPTACRCTATHHPLRQALPLFLLAGCA